MRYSLLVRLSVACCGLWDVYRTVAWLVMLVLICCQHVACAHQDRSAQTHSCIVKEAGSSARCARA
jgi:hypothetical protein